MPAKHEGRRPAPRFHTRLRTPPRLRLAHDVSRRLPRLLSLGRRRRQDLDFYVIHGTTHDDIIRGYYTLTGHPPLLPKWAFGYTQSKERYVNAREMLDVVKEYRRRKIPLDLIVLDWKSSADGRRLGPRNPSTLPASPIPAPSQTNSTNSAPA
ncbi:MAG: glycoside hydrolase family 31 protein [Nibricoccus sp.]